jgi:hypothetical protein
MFEARPGRLRRLGCLAHFMATSKLFSCGVESGRRWTYCCSFFGASAAYMVQGAIHRTLSARPSHTASD